MGSAPVAVLFAVLAASTLSDRVIASNVRSTDAGMIERLRDGCARSATFKGLVDQLDATNTIVYVERGVCGFGHFKACLPHALTVAGGTRFIRILVDPSETGAQQLALIAHELQHALEIAHAPQMRKADDITELFRRIGRSPHCPRGTPDCYETSAALKTQDAVLREILTARAAKR